MLFIYTELLSILFVNQKKCGGTPGTHNSTLKVDCKQDVTGVPGVVQYVCTDPNLQYHPQSFLGRQSPEDIRLHYDHAIGYMCQSSWPNIQAQDTYYATMFDECYILNCGVNLQPAI